MGASLRKVLQARVGARAVNGQASLPQGNRSKRGMWVRRTEKCRSLPRRLISFKNSPTPPRGEHGFDSRQ